MKRKSESNMMRTTVHLTAEQVKELLALSDKTGAPTAELIRRAIDAYLAWNDPTYSPHPNQPERKAHSSPAYKEGSFLG